VAQLCPHHDEIRRLGAEVLLVTFSTRGYAGIWSKEICPPFPMLIDRERVTYQLYGLQRSLRRAWNLRTIWRYVQLLRAGRRWAGIQGDSAQLGGDFIIDARGVIRLAHPSRDPTDRPDAGDLLVMLRDMVPETLRQAP
jgi:peroxiredoxin